VFQSSLLTAKGVDLVIACNGFFWNLSVFFIVAILITEVFFVDSCCFVTGWTYLTKSVMDASLSDDI